MDRTVRRLFVEKKPGFDVEARALLHDLREGLGIAGLTGLRVVNRYDLEGMSEAEYAAAKPVIFSEPPVDLVYDEVYPLPSRSRAFAVEYLPGQYDQRADSAAQCVQILTCGERPLVRSARLFVLEGAVSDDDLARAKAWCVNPVESREAALDKPAKLEEEFSAPPDVAVLAGFISLDAAGIASLRAELALAMSAEDLAFLQTYFRDTEKRDPTMTEVRAVDTYWSDHCRHTTFLTEITDVQVDDSPLTFPVREAWELYKKTRETVHAGKRKDVCLMDLATIGMKALKKAGKLADLDESDEINACSIAVQADVGGKKEDWLLQFKNETHNHPTEIEPFGGAATCLGGAIRDPLSGRAYVYQAMRVTGSGDPRTPLSETLPGKLSQRRISTVAAAGYSSYGNQIGLATGQVSEVYDEGYVAKRMEIGAVIGAAPKRNVQRLEPRPGDVVALLGGRTGRDGLGGATGSSKEHTEESLAKSGAEVQKGNPPTERKIQRLFRRPETARLIRRCNDFGAGGVSVAIGELADGLSIDLDLVPKKYEGLDGTELAISESQERMAVVLDPKDVRAFQAAAAEENLECVVVATVTESPRLVMTWRGKTIMDISREFLNTNGVKQQANARITAPDAEKNPFRAPDYRSLSTAEALKENLRTLSNAAQKGLGERFDGTIGASSVLLPFGGVRQLTPAEGMAAKLPVLGAETDSASLMTWGFDPRISKWSPFHGAVWAVTDSLARIAALGGDYRKARLTFQEYFEKLGKDPIRWGKPLSALLGASWMQLSLGVPAIGGKDSMSGSFKDLDVPPTLVSFAVAMAEASRVVSSELKGPGNRLVFIPLPRTSGELPDLTTLERSFSRVHELARAGRVLSAATVRGDGLAGTVSRMAFGNMVGVSLDGPFAREDLFAPAYGSIVLEVAKNLDLRVFLSGITHRVLGETVSKPDLIVDGSAIRLQELADAWLSPLEGVFPTKPPKPEASPKTFACGKRGVSKPKVGAARPRVFIPVFPGTNCEYDSARAFRLAGAEPDVLVVRNLTARGIEETIAEMSKRIAQSQILMIPGGFSGGDEPDGSGKFIATAFRNPVLRDAVMDLLGRRDGLVLGICNGFQALVKLGLVPYGEIRDLSADSPTLTFNTIGRHVSQMVRTRVSSVMSPWLSRRKVGDIHTIAVSHGEGRFIADEAHLAEMEKNGQIATQYVDLAGTPSGEAPWNPNGSIQAIEGITSPDGRVFGKMGHSERIGENVLKNVPGEKDQEIFRAGVEYFR
jgi:phosphoribosylformylglycinamidine synthase